MLAYERDYEQIDPSTPEGAYRHVLALTENRSLAERVRGELWARQQIEAVTKGNASP